MTQTQSICEKKSHLRTSQSVGQKNSIFHRTWKDLQCKSLIVYCYCYQFLFIQMSKKMHFDLLLFQFALLCAFNVHESTRRYCPLAVRRVCGASGKNIDNLVIVFMHNQLFILLRVQMSPNPACSLSTVHWVRTLRCEDNGAC